jgi:hypothetical protein
MNPATENPQGSKKFAGGAQRHPRSVGPLFNSTLQGVPPVGKRTDELIRFLESGDASLRVTSDE